MYCSQFTLPFRKIEKEKKGGGKERGKFEREINADERSETG